MTRLVSAAAVALSLVAATAAQAQSYTSPAGVPVSASQAHGR
ncbi:hypothetical protein [Methylobacterium gnaphalii]|uniref:Uncharacterized protein n=1 Tax=Methylobacterium gnaphalii TaxID=1010610 RepID=A0A512JH59_9HYPH|nr:hypothetical protein [Methylobacterium gnaphalii]GEP09192.1 hypothetical protein MGN01_10370 [Methylobacterium gnaphalii]GJD67604.1 hypothetical protein MMMDOFMJ_0520 [Methylobacterium gnaphalii]GLS50515.1 hypothetical protein GCM10007885_33670 [Methylobacterium gnaphalii]